MIREPQVFIAECIDIGGFFDADAFLAVLQHAFHNGIGAFTVVKDLLFIF
jgi:hypothetical protein